VGGVVTNAQRAERLTLAARLVAEVAADLNTIAHKCDACGLNKLENYGEGQVARQLDAVSRRLDSFASGFKRNVVLPNKITDDKDS
jgi:hypothetical protein